jgi:hypothetical protein
LHDSPRAYGARNKKNFLPRLLFSADAGEELIQGMKNSHVKISLVF